MEDVEECCKHDDIRVIFILFGDVCSIGSIVKTIRDAGKIAMVHMDLISGLSPKEIAVEFIKEQTEADGIISTKPSLIKKQKKCLCIQYSVFSYWIQWHLKISDNSST